MGNSASASGGGGEYYDDDPFDGADTLGYRVLGVQPNSPASKAGLVSFLDFLVGANGQMLLGSGADLQEGEEYDDVDLPAFLQEHLGKEIEFCKSIRASALKIHKTKDSGNDHKQSFTKLTAFSYFLFCFGHTTSLGFLIYTVVYNIKRGEARLVKLTPDDNWGGAGLMGATIRLDNYVSPASKSAEKYVHSNLPPNTNHPHIHLCALSFS
jgi:hypothetical protein